MRDTSNDTQNAVNTNRGRAGSDPERKCILSGEHEGRASLIRLVPGPDGRVWPDLGARLPGRGAWITSNRSLLENAIQKGKLKGALARAFRGPIEIPENLADQIETLLEKRALERLGLELRAGFLIFGSDKLTEWARAGRLHLILHAADAADDGVSKLAQAWRCGDGETGGLIRLPAGREALSRALGRENVVHTGVTNSKAASRISHDLQRWAAFNSNHDLIDDVRTESARRNDEGRE